MTLEVNELVNIKPITFPHEILGRVSPDLMFQRHLSLNLRPSMRGFEEFRDIEILNSKDAQIPFSENILGSNVLKCGNTVVITAITAGLIEEDNEDSVLKDYSSDENSSERNKLSNFTSIYPVVEIERGRGNAPPSDEEMIISQKLHDCILHSRLISKNNLNVKYGVRTTDLESGEKTVIYQDDNESHDIPILQLRQFKKRISYVLYAKITVFSRTGPLFDLCWNSLLFALNNTKLPRAFIDEKSVSLKTIVRSKGRATEMREDFNIICDNKITISLKLNTNNIAFASNYGIIDLDHEQIDIDINQEDSDNDLSMDPIQSTFLTDIDTEAEEACTDSTISIISTRTGNLKNVAIIGGTSKITVNMLKKSIALSKLRANHLNDQI